MEGGYQATVVGSGLGCHFHFILLTGQDLYCGFITFPTELTITALTFTTKLQSPLLFLEGGDLLYDIK